MEQQVPTVGRIVNYHTTESERKSLQVLGCNSSEVLPAMIVAVWGDTPESCVNLKVMIDGNHPDLWKTSVSLSTVNEEGKFSEYGYSWPVRK